MIKPEYQFNAQDVERIRRRRESRRPCYCWIWILLSWTIAAGVLIALLYTGIWRVMDLPFIPKVKEVTPAMREHMQEQQSKLQQSLAIITQLEQKVAITQRELSVQEVANSELRKQLGLAETSLKDSEQKLLLYEGILSPEDLKQGLHVQHLGIKPRLLDAEGNALAEQRFYQYHLVLTHIRGGGTEVNGRWQLQISGTLNGKNVTLSQQDLVLDGQQVNEQFALKYYQSIEGELQFPAGFKPDKVMVSLRVKGKQKAPSVKATYHWDSFKLARKNTQLKE